MLCYAMLCYAMLCGAALCYTMLCYAMLCYAMLCYAMLCYAMLCYAMLRCAVLCYAMLCYAMLCCAVLRYAILYSTTLYSYYSVSSLRASVASCCNVVPSSSVLVTLMMKAIHSSETSVLTRATRRDVGEDGILLMCTKFRVRGARGRV
jgi:hypothetical protein